MSKKSKADIVADAENLPFKDSIFDSIISNQVLEHVLNPNSVIKEMYRVLKNEVMVLLTVPQVWELHEEPRDYYRFTKYGISDLLEKNGFEIVQMESRGGVLQ